MKLIAFDTSTDACSCALWVDDDVRGERFEVAPRRHGELILEMVSGLLAETQVALHELDGIAFGCGPGSFTGVRIATGVVQGLAFGAELPVIAVSSLRALAQGVHRERGESRVLAAFDARMGEVYCGAYALDANGLMVAAAAEQVCAPEAVAIPDDGPWFGAGEGWATYRHALGARVGDALRGVEPGVYPHASDVARIGASPREPRVNAAQALPTYLRDRVANKKKK